MMKKQILFIFCLLLCTTLFAQKKIKVACVGNSITFGSGLAHPDVESYPSQLQQMLGAQYEVGNFGKPGATLLNKGHRPYMKQEEFKKALAFAGDIVIIHLGVNDTDPRNWPNYRDFFMKDYLALIDSFKVVNPQCRIIISRLTPISDRHRRFESGTRDWHDQIQLAIESVARYAGVQLMDFHEVLYPYPFLLPDGVHPSKEGTAMMAKAVYSAMTGDYGGLRMPELYTDNMVLQRNTLLSIKGMANAGETVTVSVARQKQTAVTDSNGKWAVTLQPLQAGGPHTLTIATKKQKLTYNNVLVGEVWLCSGQSNMEFYLNWSSTGKRDIPQTANDQIRLYDMKERWRTDAVEWDASVLDSLNYLQYYKEAKWASCSPATAASFSAVAYYFGKMLQDSLKVPVGLICNAIGGSPAEAWIDRSTLEYQFPAILRNWMQNDFIQDWVRGRAALNIKKSAIKFQRHPYEPCYLYEAGILPLQQFPIKGVLWYQGESNAHNREAHEKLFKLLVESWRKNWGNKELPFYYVQLSSLNRPSWTWFRDSQRRMMSEIPNTGMAVSSDQGDSLNVHPTNKQPIGERLARWALHNTYGQSMVIPSGPLFHCAEFRDGAVYVTFDYAEGLCSADGLPLRTFEVAEVDGLYEAAVAEVENNRLKVYSEKVKNPRYVRYGWQPFTRANLVNRAGLPASTFRAEAPADLLEANIRLMQGFPKKDKAFAKGVSACFAGMVDGQLLIAGGSNFPDVLAIDGGIKKYYQDVYAAELINDSLFSWQKVGKLPHPTAYGVSVSTADGIICVGGMNAAESLNSVYRIRMENKKAVVETLPSLSFTWDNMAGAMLGNVLYVVGGNKDKKVSNSFYCLDLENLPAGWQELPEFPGLPRIQPVCVGQLNEKGEPALYLWGGFVLPAEGREASMSVDGYVYSPSSRKWMSLVAPINKEGEEVSLGGGVAAALGDSLILCTGGVHKDIFMQAFQHPASQYMAHPAEWYHFNNRVLVYNTRRNLWQEVIAAPWVARAGAALVHDGQSFFCINGELKPGIRTPEISRILYKLPAGR